MAENLGNMTLGQVREKARKAGIDNVGRMNKGELINALGGGFDTQRGGGQRQRDPRGADPRNYKNAPGNRT